MLAKPLTHMHNYMQRKRTEPWLDQYRVLYNKNEHHHVTTPFNQEGITHFRH